MATTTNRPTATRAVAVALLLIAICVTVWLLLVRTDEQQRTVIRLTQPVAAGEYLTSADIEAIQLTVEPDDAPEYVTADQAGSGLIAAQDLAPGDVLFVSNVYTTGQQPAPTLTTNVASPGVGTLTLFAIAAGAIGILGILVWVGRRRSSPRPVPSGVASSPTNRTPGWLHVEVNTWITEDGDWKQLTVTRPPTETSSTTTEQWAPRRTVTDPNDADFAIAPGAVKVDEREQHDTESQDDDGATVPPEADGATAPDPTANILYAPPTQTALDESDMTEAASLKAFKPTQTDTDNSIQQIATGDPDGKRVGS